MTQVLATSVEETGSPDHSDQAGQSLVEYAFILILVAIVCLVLVMALGHQTANLYSNIASGLST